MSSEPAILGPIDWQQKFAAIKAFAGDAAIEMRKPGDWYVGAHMTIGGDGMLTGKYGNGTTPAEAVEDHWRIYSKLPFDRYAVNRENRRARWNGFMWEDVPEEVAAIIRGDADA